MLIRMFMASAPAFVRALNCKQHKCPPIVKWTLDYLYRILQNASAIISKWLSHNIVHLTDINAEWKKSDTEEYVFIQRSKLAKQKHW